MVFNALTVVNDESRWHNLDFLNLKKLIFVKILLWILTFIKYSTGSQNSPLNFKVPKHPFKWAWE